ncbi:MAG TPA: SsrA-binding protein SmpB [Planctomycetota bacterium]|nr:SsrA-binding protein SmpB [Planctomycetota bacterium]
MAKKEKDTNAVQPYQRVVARNPRAWHDYHIDEKFEAGIALSGSEVKSLRTRNVSFADCYSRVYENECWLIGLQITTYDKAHVQVPDPVRQRKLLLKRREIDKLRGRTEKSGMTIVPLEIYFKGPWVKVLLGLARGKSFEDRRSSIKEKEMRRDIDRALRIKRAK